MTSDFLIIIILGGRNFGLSCRNFSAGLSRLNFTCPQNYSTFRLSFFDSVPKLLSNCPVELHCGLFWKNCFSTISLDFELLFFGTSSKKVDRVVETTVYMSWETIWRRKILRKIWNFSIITQLGEWKLGLSARKLSAGYQQWFLKVKWNNLRNVF